MLSTLNAWDESLFIYLNGFHHPYADTFMALVTHRNTWIPLYIYIIVLLVRLFNKQSLYYIITIVILITLSDRITSGIMKPVFHRLRPCHQPVLQKIIHVVGSCGGQFGFASSHAANTVALAVFLFLLLKGKKKWVWLMLPWAFLVSYSRIYTGAHYPGDIIIGALIGAFLAIIIFRLLQSLLIKFRSPRLSTTS